MISHVLTLVRTILGIIGNVISFGLFLSPTPTIKGYFVKKSTEQFHPYYYLAGNMNCMLWVLYGLIHPNSTLVWTINGIGLVMYLFYTATFFYFTGKKWRIVIAIGFLVELIFIFALAFSVVRLVKDPKLKSTISGTFAVVFNVILYGSPLSVLVMVCKTKSVKYLPFWVSLAGFANGTVWTIYGLLPVDVNLLIGNGLGAGLSLLQLILHCIWGHPVDNFIAPFIFVFGKKAPKDVEKAVELENVEVAK